MAYASSGMEFVAAVGLFSFSGLWLDQRLDLLPLFTLLGFAVGLSLGFLSLYKTVHRLEKLEEEESAGRETIHRPGMKFSARDDSDGVPK